MTGLDLWRGQTSIVPSVQSIYILHKNIVKINFRIINTFLL